ncbi:hypothetical protein LOTGIDRAFT_153567 [Lottia gigantea]|uniref:CCHC-type domain-containing protein n=1 Tax=Lottia gigantea TaxID=225164 RepID=V3ZIM0_LOTGI|nr:hypothetical protein LOTGIDRAFT_153567 [Lottia gigantea]ESO91133.1 hypothetical protein LOTGIDRAFT_153567 [Lottia gigantea]
MQSQMSTLQLDFETRLGGLKNQMQVKLSQELSDFKAVVSELESNLRCKDNTIDQLEEALYSERKKYDPLGMQQSDFDNRLLETKQKHESDMAKADMVKRSLRDELGSKHGDVNIEMRDKYQSLRHDMSCIIDKRAHCYGREAVQAVKLSISNQKLIIGSRKNDVRRVSLFDSKVEAHADDQSLQLRALKPFTLSKELDSLRAQVIKVQSEISTNERVGKILEILNDSRGIRSRSPSSNHRNAFRCFTCQEEGQLTRECPLKDETVNSHPVHKTVKNQFLNLLYSKSRKLQIIIFTEPRQLLDYFN